MHYVHIQELLLMDVFLLMDLKLGQAKSENKLSKHIIMGSDAAKAFLNNFEIFYQTTYLHQLQTKLHNLFHSHAYNR